MEGCSSTSLGLESDSFEYQELNSNSGSDAFGFFKRASAATTTDTQLLLDSPAGSGSQERGAPDRSEPFFDALRGDLEDVET